MAKCNVTGRSGVSGRLEHWGIDYPREGPIAILNQIELTGDLAAGSTKQRTGGLCIASGEEYAVARLGTHMLCNSCAFLLGDVFCYRASQFAVFADEDVGQALGSALFSPFLPSIELTARLGRAALHDDSANIIVLEHAERGVLEELGALDNLDIETQVGLVGAVQTHRIGVGHARNRRGNVVADERPQGLEDLFRQGDDILLVHEAHLDIKLGELRLAVGTEVFIAVAAGDLVVTLHAGNHQQLLEQLRRLG